MNKTELVAAVAAHTGEPKTATKATIETALALIGQALQADEPVALAGFGTFEVKFRTAREGRDPQSGKAITIPTHHAPIFRPGSELKRLVNERG